MTAPTEEYNGWPTRETWAVHLHLSNDQALYGEALALTRDAAETWQPSPYLTEFYGDPVHGAERRQTAGTAEAGAALRDWLDDVRADVQGAACEPGACVPRELVALVFDVGSFDRIEWHDVAEALLEDAHEVV